MSGTPHELNDAYASALADFLGDPGEDGRTRAYDFGRRALALGLGVVDLAAIHGQALAKALADADTPARRMLTTHRAAEFLGETLAPSEMMLRGYREANDALLGLNESLERRVRERTEALQEADRRKDEFLALLAHELRNPLAPIRNALYLIGMDQVDPQTMREARDVMERQLRHMVRLVDDLMDVSRITRGKIELRKERLDVSAIARAALEISRPHLESAGHQVTVSLPGDPVFVHADPARLAQVLANLLNNAAKYTEPGGRVWLTASAEGGRARVRVRDSGIGIPATMLPTIFDLFVQVDNSVSRSQGGLGIGLTLVKRLVELHGGTVEASSPGPGQGSEFVITLPLAPADAGVAEKTAAPRDEGQTPVRVLVVDDNRDAADSLAMVMRLAGHQVRVAHDAREAVTAALEFRPRVMLQDIEMPGMSGYDVARRVREQFPPEDVLLVAVTGFGSDEARRLSREAGFDDHLVKPVDFDALRELMKGCQP